MYRRLQLILVTLLSVSLSIAPARQAKATAQAGSAILSFANLSHEKTAFDVYLGDGSAQPIVTNSQPQSIGGVVELPAGDWTINLLKAGSAADSKPVFSQTLTLSAGEHTDLIALGSLDGKDADAFALKLVTLNYEAIPDNTTRIGVLDLLPDAPEVYIRFGTKFVASHIKYGDFKEIDESGSPQKIYASPQETILPDDQNYAKITSFAFDTSAYHLLVLYGNKSDPTFVDLHTPTKYSFVRFVNAAEGSPVADFSEGPDHFAAMLNIAFSKASYWIPLPGGLTTFFNSATHDPQPKYYVSLGSMQGVKLEAGASYLVLTFGTYDGSGKNNTNLADLPIPRKQQNGKATILVLNLVKDSGPISVVDSTGKTVDQLSHIKYGDFRSVSDINPVKTSLQFVDDKSGKALMQFATYPVEADTIYAILLVGTVDNPVGINVPSSPDTLSVTAN